MKKPLPILALLLLTACAANTKQDGGQVVVHSYGATGGAGSLGYHTVQSGENLETISSAYGLSMASVLEANRLNNGTEIRPGTRLALPPPEKYQAREGDTPKLVAKMFNMSIEDVIRQNELAANAHLQPGQQISLAHQNIIAMQPGALNPAPLPAAVPAVVTSEVLSPVAAAPLPANPKQAQITPVAMPQVAPQSLKSMPPVSGGGFIKPVAGRVLSGYGAQLGSGTNDGINIEAAKGSGVMAAESGRVVYADDKISGYGNMVLVKHSNGYITAYAHLDKMLVAKGDALAKGQVLGTVGKTGNVKTPQLHFEIRQGTKPVNPQAHLKGI